MDFDKIIKENKQNIKNIIRIIAKEDNDDLEQEVYLKIWKNKDKYNAQGSSKSWVSVIAKNTALDYLKSVYHRVFSSSVSDDETVSKITDNSATPESSALSVENRNRIMDCIDNLKPKFRQVIVLCEIDGLSYEECAKKLNCPIGTIKSRLYNAKQVMAKELEDLL